MKVAEGSLQLLARELKPSEVSVENVVRGHDRYTTAIINDPLHVGFDAEIMQSWVGLPQSADLPSTFYVDDVRVWRKAE